MKRSAIFSFFLLFSILGFSIVSAQEEDRQRDSSVALKAMLQIAQQQHDVVSPLAVQGGNSIYTVAVDETGTGQYTARTGAGHPVPNRNVLYGGTTNGTSTNYSTIRSYSTNSDYSQSASPTSSFTLRSLSGYHVSTVAIGTTGYRTTWNIASPDNLRVVQDVNVIGAVLEDSRIAISTTITNQGATTALLGVRYLWDYQIGSDDGPSFTQVNPDVAAIVNESTFAPPAFEFYSIEDNNTASSPVFSVSGTGIGPSAFAPTQPEMIKFVCWPSAFSAAFDYNAIGSDCSTDGRDSAVLYYFGATQNSALQVPPGQSVTVTEYVFAIPPATNVPPVAVDDTESLVGMNPVNISVLTNDFDLDGDTLLLIAVTQPTYGTATANVNGTVTYTPTSVSPTGTDTFTYTISDGILIDTATVTINFEANNPPVAEDDNARTNTNTPVTIPVLDNDWDLDNDPLSIAAVNPPSTGTAVANADGTVTYTPPAGFTGTATFSYVVSDGIQQDTANVTVVVNTPPVAVDDAVTTFVSTPVTIPVLANDSDPDGQALTVISVGLFQPGSYVINPDNTVTYTPENLWFGVIDMQYTISDGIDTATARLTVTIPNRPPTAVDDSAETPINTPVTVNVLANDTEPDGHLMTLLAVSTPPNGAAQINPDESVTYTPNPGFVGIDTFTYTVTDDFLSVTATVTINVVQTCTDADRNPELDLDHEESLLLPESGYHTGRIVNRSTRCSYEVGIASYLMFDGVIDNQRLFDSAVAVIPPGGSLELTIELPACATQVDLFYGPLLDNLMGQRYGDRLIEGLQLGLPTFCAPDTPPAP